MKNHLLLYLFLGVLFLSFSILSLLVFLSKGKNKYLTSKKIAIGAMIISLTCMTNGCRPFVTCYEVAVEPVMNCTDSVNNDGVIVVNRDDSEIEFNCMYLHYESVSYILSSNAQTIFSGDCIKTDSDTSQNLKVPIPRQMDTGNFKLQFYFMRAAEIGENTSPFSVFDVKVID